MKNIVTIGWGNWHSHVLHTLKNSDFFWELQISSLVSMSDDGRTTGKIMQQFEQAFWKHLPPPWDLRRCLYALWESKYDLIFQDVLERTITLEWNISDYTLHDLFSSCWIEDDFLQYLQFKNTYFLNFSLEIDKPIVWHKLWNILMACLYKNFLYDYNYMLKFMHDLLDVSAHVIAITTDKAYIEAKLENGEIIQKQDHISNVADYNSKIQSLWLMKDSYGAKHNFKIDTAILNAKYIIVCPGDLFTSNISNLIIWGINSLLRKSNAKIVYISNTTNKWWETQGYSIKDFTEKLEAYLWKNIDILVVNNKKQSLTPGQEKQFINDISIKGWEYIYISEEERNYFESSWTCLIETDLLSESSLYKHDSEKLWSILKKILV